MAHPIHTLRSAEKLRQRDLASQLKISVKELSKIERGLIPPTEHLLEQAAQIFAVDRSVFEVPPNAPIVIGEGYQTTIPTRNFSIDRCCEPTSNRFHIIDLFCGIGGFSHGFEQTNQFEVTLALDLLPDRAKTFALNHPYASVLCQDIQTLTGEALATFEPHPDVLIGSPPCQGFSSIRPFRTLTEGDSRNNLFEHFALALNTLKPKWFVIENVIGLLTHQSGKTFQSMLSLFEQIGYAVDWRILNAAFYGLPQRRERLIIVGNLMGVTDFEWPLPTHTLDTSCRSMAGKNSPAITPLPLFSSGLEKAVSTMQAIGDLPEISSGEEAHTYRTDIQPSNYAKQLRGSAQHLTLHRATQHSPHMMNIIQHAGFNRSALPDGLTTSGFSSSYSRLEPDIPSVTLTVNFVHPSSNKCIHPYQDRALTPREGARLQGFEDAYAFEGTKTQITKQIGNAVPPILGQVIAKALLRYL